jgi:hypothetical protein
MLLLAVALIAIMVAPMAVSAKDPQYFTSNGHTYGGDEKEPWRGSIFRVNFIYNNVWTETDWTPEWTWSLNELWENGQGGSKIAANESYDDSGKHYEEATIRIYHSADFDGQTYGYHEVADPDSADFFHWERWSNYVHCHHP